MYIKSVKYFHNSHSVSFDLISTSLNVMLLRDAGVGDCVSSSLLTCLNANRRTYATAMV
jgi:hypothetical protein